MRIDVALLPSLLRVPEQHVCVVIDVLRATSTLVTLAACGATRIRVVPELQHAFDIRGEAIASGGPAPLLCGEVGGLPPEGFDFGNSPVEFKHSSLIGRPAVLYTSNGTRALVYCAASPSVFVGSFLNRTAVVAAAVSVALRAGTPLTFVCSGTDLGTAFSFEDTFCAGALVESARSVATEVELGDSAEAALRLYRSFGGDTLAAFKVAEHGRTLERLGLGHDLEFCATEDYYTVAPTVQTHGDAVYLVT